MNRKIFAMAEWLLERFGIPQRNESLTGDLMEEYSAGRSAFWLLRQIANAIATTVARDIKHHWLLTARAIAMGWVLLFGWAQTVSHFHRVDGFIVILPNLLLPPQIVLSLTFTLWPAFVAWLLARTHRVQQAAVVLAYAASLAIYGICGIAILAPGIKRQRPSFFQWEFLIGEVCAVVFFTLIGGFLQKPRGLIGAART